MRRLLVPVLSLQALAATAYAAEQPESNNEPIALEQMEVTATGAERGDGPVDGYRATRSVSATRTDTPIHEIPQSISVVPGQVVEDIAATRLEDALDYAGGVERGTIDVAIALKAAGPASMLYGRGDPGGTFNIVSKQPQAERRTVLGTQFNTEGLRRGTLDTTGALDEQAEFTYRLNLVAEGANSFRDHVESERYNIAPVLRWDLSDATAIIFEGDYLHNRHPLDRGLPRYANQQGELPRDRFLGEERAGKFSNENATTQLRIEHLLDDQWTLRGGVQYLDGSLEGGAVENNGLAADGRTVGRNYSERWLEWNDFAVQANLEGRFSALGFMHTLLTGIEYDDFNYSSRIDRSAGGVGAFPIDMYDPVYGQPLPAIEGPKYWDDEDLKSYAFYMQDQVEVTDRFTLQLGARLERFEQNYVNKLSAAGSWDQSHNAVSPRIGAIYDLTEALAVYANASRSFKPNRGADRNSQAFDPEEGIAYETGVKYALPEHNLSVTAALFHITKENVLTADPANVGSQAFQVAAGEVRSRGFDLSVAGNITPQWRVIGGYAYVDAEITESNSAAVPVGTRLANVPEHSFNLLDTYEFDDGALNGLGLGVGVKYVGSRKGTTTSTAYDMDAYTVVDLLAYYPLTDRVRLNLNLENVFDEEYYERAWNVWAYPGAPRTLQAGISIEL